MAWIEVHQQLAGHPKVLDVADDLEVCAPQVMGHLLCLWMWALEYAEDGDLSGFSVRRIEGAAQWPGEPGALVEALRRRGWLDEGDVIHDWWEYAGKLVERRRDDARRKAEARKGGQAGQPTADDRRRAAAPATAARREEEAMPAETSTEEAAASTEGAAAPPAGPDAVSDGRPADVRGMSGGRPADVLRNTTTTIPNRRSPNRTRDNPPPPPDASETGGRAVVVVEAAFDEIQIMSREARDRALAGWLAATGEALRVEDVRAWAAYLEKSNKGKRNGNRLGPGVAQMAMAAGRRAPDECYRLVEDSAGWERYVIE